MKIKQIILISAMVSTSVFAVEKGDWLLHIRAINVNPNDDSSVLNVAGSDLAGTGVTVDGSNSLDISIGYMLTDNFAIEVLADLSSKHDVSVFGLAGLDIPNGTKVVKSNVLPPTLFAQYHFNPKGKVRPYAGLGLNYTLFFNDDLTTAAQTALGPVSVDIDINPWVIGIGFGKAF